MDLTVPADVPLRDPETFRWIRQPLPRIDVRAKSTDRANYSLDVTVDGMLLAAVQHAPRLGLVPASLTNLAEVDATRGVHSVHLLADRFWQARRAA